MSEKDSDIQRIRFNFARASTLEKQQLEKHQNDYNQLRKKIQGIDEELTAKKIVIKKLVDHVLNWRVKAKKTYDKDHYGVPLSTFWLPLDFQENIETDYEKEEYRMNLVEELKKKIVNESTKTHNPKLEKMAVEDYTVEAKRIRTMLGYHEYADGNEELVFKKLVPKAEAISNEILDIVPHKIRETFREL